MALGEQGGSETHEKAKTPIKHLVVIFDENISFDHYFGTMAGVRGFGDPHARVVLVGLAPAAHGANRT